MTQDPVPPTEPKLGDAPPQPAPEPEPQPAPEPEPPPRQRPSRFQLMIGRDLVALGFLLVAAVSLVAIAFLSTASDIATVIGPVTTLVGTLVGAVFGVQVGNEGRERESTARQTAETRALQAAALVEPAAGADLVEMWENSSGNGNPGPEDF